MKNRLIILFLLIAIPVFAMGQAPHLPGVIKLQNMVSDQLMQIDSSIAQAAQDLATVDLQSDSAKKVLNSLYKNIPSAVDIATIDLSGNLLLIEPDKYKGSEGQNISDQPHIARIRADGKPVMSDIFKTIEGFYAAAIVFPIYSSHGKLTGYVSMVFKPDALMGNIINPYLSTMVSTEAMAIQKDGRVIYDKDILQVGKMTFSDPLYQPYPSLLDLARRVTAEVSGSGTYQFPAGPGQAPVTKTTEWTSVSLHDVEWRIILSKAAN